MVILIFGFWTFNLYALDGDLWNLVQLPTSSIIWKDKPLEINGIKARGTHLSTNSLPPQIINFYQETLAKQGWQLKDYFKEQNILGFIKNNKYMYVAIQDNGQGLPCDVYLISSPADLALCRILKNFFLNEEITPDTPGKDISDIVRYPQSRRRISIFAPEEGAILLYEAEGKPQEIASFYKQHLRLSGWQPDPVLSSPFLKLVAPQTQREEVALLLFEKKDDVLLIIIYGLPKGLGKGRSIITVTRNMLDEFTHTAMLEEE